MTDPQKICYRVQIESLDHGQRCKYPDRRRAHREGKKHSGVITLHDNDNDIELQLIETPAQEQSDNNLECACPVKERCEYCIRILEKPSCDIQWPGEKAGRGRTCGNFGCAYYSIEERRNAIQSKGNPLFIALKVNHECALADNFCNHGCTFTSTGEYKKAIKFYEEKLCIAELLDNKPEQGRAFGSLGNVYTIIGEYEKAILFHKKHLDIAERLGDKLGQGCAYYGLGKAYQGLEKHEEAIQYHKRDLAIAEELDDKPGQGRAHCNLGCAYSSIGKHNEAIRCHKEALNIECQLGDKSGEGCVYSGLGDDYRNAGKYSKAISNYKKHLHIATELESLPRQMIACNKLGQVYYDVGDFQNAVKYFGQELEIAKRLDHQPSQCSAYSGLGKTYGRMGKTEAAQKYHDRELRIAQERGDKLALARAYSGHGCVHWGRNEIEEAIEYYKKDHEIAIAYESMDAKLRASGNLGDAYRSKGDSENALEFFNQYLPIAKKLGNKRAQLHARACLGIEKMHSGELFAASRHLNTFKQFLCDMESQLAKLQLPRSHMGLVEQYAEAMDALVMAAGQAGEMNEALRLEEWRRCRSEMPYLSKYGESTSMNMERIGGEFADREIEDMAKRVDASYVVIFKFHEGSLLTWVLSGETGKLVHNSIQKDSPKVSEIPRLVKSATFLELAEWKQALCKAHGEIQRKHKQKQKLTDEWLIELCERVIPDKMRGNNNEDLWNSIRSPNKFREAVFNPDKDVEKHFFKKAEKALDELSKILWSPIVENCPELKRQLEGSSVLRKPAHFVSYDDPKEGKHFAEDCDWLCKMLGCDVHAGDAATTDTVMNLTRRSSSLHVVAHGVNVDETMWAGIQLSNGALYAFDLNEHLTEKKIDQDKQRTRLWVLCTCSSGLGQHTKEGLQGFARSARAGGCPCLLASKWDIPTRESIQLMEYFYAFMATREDEYKSVAEAFQAAVTYLLEAEESEFRKSYFYWGAFVPHGFADVQLDKFTLKNIYKFLSENNLIT